MDGWQSEVDAIFKELSRATRTSSKPANPQKFITKSEIIEIWRKHDRVSMVLNWDTSRQAMNSDHPDILAILSILVEIGALKVLRNIYSTFFNRDSNTPIFTDQQLPLTKEQIEQFVDNSPQVSLFLDKQYKFCPIVISCTNGPETFSKDRPLPFLTNVDTLGKGAYGKVSLVKIAPGYLEREGAHYQQPYEVACKKFKRAPEDFDKEVENLQSLEDGLTKQSHILHPLATIRHGEDRYILSTYAGLGDLSGFLFSDSEGGFVRKFPGIPLAGDHKIYRHLLRQCYGLADALQWLHKGITRGDSRTTYFSHMDLKPDNILIQQDPQSEVGKWVISDFGISVVHKEQIGTGPNQEWLTMNTSRKRAHGSYSAPEVALWHGVLRPHGRGIGRKSDIWSFGCIFSQVLAWATGRGEGVNRFGQRRLEKFGCDYFYEHTDEGKPTGPVEESFAAHAVTSWLSEIENDPNQHPGVACWARTIGKILIGDPDHRPDSTRLLGLVKHVYSHFLDHPPEGCLQALSEVQSVSPPRTPTSHHDADHPFRRDSKYRPPSIPPPTTASNALPETLSPYIKSSGLIYLRDQTIEKHDSFAILSKKIGHLLEPESNVSLSKSVQDGKIVTLALFGDGQLLVYELNLESWDCKARGKWELMQSKRWEKTGVTIEGTKFVVWGYSPSQQKRLHCIGELNDTSITSLQQPSDSIKSLKYVAISTSGAAAFVRDRDILLRPRWDACDQQTLLKRDNTDDQIFAHAEFDESGKNLYAWANGSKRESLFVWNCADGKVKPEPSSALHFSLENRGPLQSTKVLPFNGRYGCILAAAGKREYLAVSLAGDGKTLHGERNRADLKHAKAGCIFGDNYFIALETTKTWGSCLAEYRIPPEHNAVCSRVRELCRVKSKLVSDSENSLVMRIFNTPKGQTAVLCNVDSTVEFVPFFAG